MAQIILDSGGWHDVIDFETGDSLESWDNPVIDDVIGIISGLPYPGEVNPDSIEWTTSVGKALYDYNQPDFIMLSYATPYFIKSTVPSAPEDEKELNRRLFSSVQDFLSYTGYVPVIVGSGGMTDIIGEVLPTSLRGRVNQGMGSFPYGGIFHATEDEMESVGKIPHTKLVTRDDFMKDFPQAGEDFIAELPDGLLLLEETGYVFSRAGIRGMTLYKTPNVTGELPVYTTLQTPGHITDVRRVIEEALDDGDKAALIVLDGIGAEDFLVPYGMMPANDKWMLYASTMSQYMALLSGQPFYECAAPLVHEHRPYKDRSNRHPYAQFTDKDMPSNVLGRKKGIKTAAAGSRSMITHSVSQADISIECHARQMIPSGILAMVNDPK